MNSKSIVGEYLKADIEQIIYEGEDTKTTERRINYAAIIISLQFPTL